MYIQTSMYIILHIILALKQMLKHLITNYADIKLQIVSKTSEIIDLNWGTCL